MVRLASPTKALDNFYLNYQRQSADQKSLKQTAESYQLVCDRKASREERIKALRWLVTEGNTISFRTPERDQHFCTHRANREELGIPLAKYLKASLGKGPYCLRPCHMPYAIGERGDIRHYTFWLTGKQFLKGCTDEKKLAVIRQIVEKELPYAGNMKIWKNPVLRQSVPFLEHYHILFVVGSKKGSSTTSKLSRVVKEVFRKVCFFVRASLSFPKVTSMAKKVFGEGE